MVHRDVGVRNIILYPNYESNAWKVFSEALKSQDLKKIISALIYLARNGKVSDSETGIEYDDRSDNRGYVLTVSIPFDAPDAAAYDIASGCLAVHSHQHPSTRQRASQ